eukprot:8724483-Pyramimonas_sp.AAC.1
MTALPASIHKGPTRPGHFPRKRAQSHRPPGSSPPLLMGLDALPAASRKSVQRGPRCHIS